MFRLRYVPLAVLMSIMFLPLHAQKFPLADATTHVVAGEGSMSLQGEIAPGLVPRGLGMTITRISAALPHAVHAQSVREADVVKQQWGPAPIPQATVRENSGAFAPNLRIGTNYQANTLTQNTPMDNTIAVSRAGIVVSAGNWDLSVRNAAGQNLAAVNWYDFFAAQQPTAMIYDPRILYDAVHDRFILVVLHGFTWSESRIFVCFSKSANPMEGWWVFTIAGANLRAGSWFDFPSIGVSEEDFYLCGNMYNDNSQYQGTILLQIDKRTAFTGTPPRYRYWNVSNGFTLLPASWGRDGGYGPGIYCVSTLAAGGNTVTLWDVTDDYDGSPELQSSNISVATYAPPRNASQQGTAVPLNTNDCRVLSAFYLKGTLHYVHNDASAAGEATIRYNRMNVSAKTVQHKSFGLQGYSYAYPAVASYSNSDDDHSAVLGFLRSSASIYPEARAVAVDNAMEFTPSVLLRGGQNWVYTIGNTETERWGDYTGIARRPGTSVPEVWVSGCYGNASSRWGGWVAQLSDAPVGGITSDNGIPTLPSLYPNPASGDVRFRFHGDAASIVEVRLYDAMGRLLRTLFRDRARAGENEIAIRSSALQPGVYYVRILTNDTEVRNEKFVVVR
ncbi:MAG TPA: T9SS type A sorting domain-containing protein [Bacteroidota bacterium]|nr:T9SS type A sorting domain-containing protein [Bacteroidota bacterium]